MSMCESRNGSMLLHHDGSACESYQLPDNAPPSTPRPNRFRRSCPGRKCPKAHGTCFAYRPGIKPQRAAAIGAYRRAHSGRDANPSATSIQLMTSCFRGSKLLGGTAGAQYESFNRVWIQRFCIHRYCFYRLFA